MKPTTLPWVLIATVLTLAGRLVAHASPVEEVPENLARKARVSASDQFSPGYAPQFAVDGRIAPALTTDDAGAAWAIRGDESKFHGWFTLQWATPIDVAEIVYYRRMTTFGPETFKDYKVFLDDAAKPVARGAFKNVSGPQRITIPRTSVKKIQIEFVNAYPSHNPGAAEIEVFSTSPSDAFLRSITREQRTAAEKRLAEDFFAGKFGFRDILVIQRHAMPLTHVYTYHVEGFKRGGGLYVLTPGPDGGKLRRLVDSTEGEILDCDLSPDGREVVFSWKRGGMEMAQPHAMGNQEVDRSNPDHDYQIYRVNIDGSGLKQLTHGACNNLNACWLPDGGIAFISDRKPAYAYCWVTTSPVLYRMDRDGRRQKRLSANYLMDFSPSALSDGRIIYTRWEYVDRPRVPSRVFGRSIPTARGFRGFTAIE